MSMQLETRFLESERSSDFRARHYPTLSADEWIDWRWQQQNLISTLAQIEKIVILSENERSAISKSRNSLPLSITPYYASLIEDFPEGAVRRTVLPVEQEFVTVSGESPDPLAEDDQSPAPGIVHRYPDRVLFLVTALCSTYCRYCTRSRVVGNFSSYRLNRTQWKYGLQYIQENPQIHDVVLSGGDPLVLSDSSLDWLLEKLTAIPHVEVIRIGTKAVAVLPQRITPRLCEILRRDKAVWMNLHFVHPSEITEETELACKRLIESGLPLVSQTVLLAGINDDANTLASLFRGLIRNRVKPYYLYQCDPVTGSAHFRTNLDSGMAIMKKLRGNISGLAVPTYVVDAPGGGGKIPILPNPIIGKHEDFVLMENFEGREFRYPDPNSPAVTTLRPMPDRT